MRIIEITTTQNVTIQHELADLKDRFLAWFIDFLVIMVSIAVLAGVLGVIGLGDGAGALLYVLILLSVFLFYTLAFEIFTNGQTPGKKALNLRVVKLSGKQASVTDYIIRWVFRSVDIYVSVGSLGAVLISSSDKNQRLGGMLSNTAVVKLAPVAQFSLADILKINSLDNYQPTYINVRHFSESDMLVVKQTIDRYKRYPNAAHQTAVQRLVDKVAKQLAMDKPPTDGVAFLKTLLTDYIVLTR